MGAIALSLKENTTTYSLYLYFRGLKLFLIIFNWSQKLDGLPF